MEKVDKKCLSGMENKKVILCVSGGVDSMVLLDLVCRYKDEMNIDVVVCHFEHGIRGIESELDMRLVQKKCEDYGVQSIVRRENIPAICGNCNVEETARNRRYAFFYECAKEKQSDVLVLAHHRDDNCETVIMNIIRGCGTKGLCGMQRISGKLFRPFLEFSKEQLYAYASKGNIEFREDGTNADVNYMRNSIRHEIVPLLKSKNPRIDETINKMRQIVSCENDFLDEYVSKLGWIIDMPHGYDIEVREYMSAHTAIKRRSVFYVLSRLVGKDYDYRAFEDIDALSYKQAGKVVCLPGGVRVYKGENALSFVKDREPITIETKLNLCGETKTPFGVFKAEKAESINLEQIRKTGEKTACFSLPDLCTLTVRSRKIGDKISCFGGGSKKLKDVFINRKLPVFLRDFVPIVCCNDDIIWVPGVIRSNAYPFKEGSGIRMEFTGDGKYG